MKKVTFESYRRPNGHDEFVEWLSKIPTKDSAKLLRVIHETEENGLLVTQRLQWIKKLDTNLYELRSKVSSNIQRALYFHVDGTRYIITHGFTKKQNKTPLSQIQHGKTLRKEWFDNENR
ncbi:type II toxin-antitoxin system RelE/ParE family toxin [Lactobacillus sp. CC-MHH1034]|uniref:type II toxin-antitoxin system RelE/ParE family toxin n=1 Tax=Agrilactobacillus fermenti TaxID=2586909 RepID=UPI001E5B3437|nr:type II toxin-antitoxin system RelE/ParE family toxin [Agrilactobacillus fermenti]MCD2255745.1 type II toxin-antitoxin system RelE/ParE family toxin [Agrilactobacillus fermenti]